jgi:hypothetical protein
MLYDCKQLKVTYMLWFGKSLLEIRRLMFVRKSYITIYIEGKLICYKVVWK